MDSKYRHYDWSGEGKELYLMDARLTVDSFIQSQESMGHTFSDIDDFRNRLRLVCFTSKDFFRDLEPFRSDDQGVRSFEIDFSVPFFDQQKGLKEVKVVSVKFYIDFFDPDDPNIHTYLGETSFK